MAEFSLFIAIDALLQPPTLPSPTALPTLRGTSQ